METRTGRIVVVAAMLLALAACGGGGAGDGGSATDAGGGAASVEPGAPASEAPPVTSLPAMSLPALESGDPSTADVCGLVTVDEMGGLFGVSGVTQGFFAGPPDTCDYQLDGAPFVAMVLTPTGAGFVFDALAADGASELKSGIGDRALYNSQQLAFLVQKGDRLLAISTFDMTRTDEERATILEEIAKIAAGRM